MADRLVGRAVTWGLGLFPLLPTGPAYLDVRAAWWQEAALIALASLALFQRLAANGAHERGHRQQWSADAGRISRGYLCWLLVVTGSALVGVAALNVIASEAFVSELGNLPGRLFAPMNQGEDLLYPVRVWLTMVEGAVAFWLLTSIFCASERPDRLVRSALRGSIVGIGLVATIAIVQHQSELGLQPYWVFMNPELVRSHATLEDPNSLGSFLVLGVGIVLGTLWAQPRGWAGRRRRLLLGTVAVLAVVALYTTASRAALAALPLAAVGVAALLPGADPTASRWRRRARIIAVGLLLVSIGWLAMRMSAVPRPVEPPASPWEALGQTADPRTPIAEVLKNRQIMWSAAATMFAEAPFLGAGLGTFPRYYARLASGQRPENAHSFFLQVLAEAGIAGLLSWMLLVGAVFMTLRKHIRRPRRVRWFVIGLAMGLSAWLLTSVTGHPGLTVSNQIWIGFVLAIATTLLNLPAAPAGTGAHVPRRRVTRATDPRLKRAFDVAVATVGLTVLSPVLLLVGGLVRLDSPGPVFFRHRRITTAASGNESERGSGDIETREFELVKFRTMFDDVNPYAPSPTRNDDPRITHVGRLLRRTCLDELPQLWNVLRGDLSLVGPRPEMPWIVEQYSDADRRRLRARPGITGLWQLRGKRDRPMHHDAGWDLAYLRIRSIRVDLAILVETAFFVVGRRNR